MDALADLHVERLAYGGAGVAHAPDGRAVFVRGSCPGDTVAARVVAEHKRYLEAEVVEVIDASPDRVAPPCPYFGRCGGCQWQHISYDTQAVAKRDAVADSLSRIGDVGTPEMMPTVTSTNRYGYRNKVELAAGTGEQGRLVLGLHVEGATDIVEIDRCMLLPERAGALPGAVSGALRFLSRGTDLALDRVVLRVAFHTRDLELDLWTRPGPFPRQGAVRALAGAASPTSLTRVICRDPAAERHRPKVEVLDGKGHWRERLGGRTFRVSAPSFFQVNSQVAEDLSRLVLDEASPGSSDRVLDLFAGVGTFTLPLASVAGEVVAIESSGAALRDLAANLDGAGLRAEIAPGDAARALADAGAFDVAVVDPPRAGLGEGVVAALAAGAPRRIVYVSCDPATLARDVKQMRAAGFRLIRATPVDLFPQTYHVETVAVLDACR